MHNILFLTDFSEGAQNAMKYALELSKKMAAKLHIVNCYELPYSHPGMSSSIMELIRQDSEKALFDLEVKIKAMPEFADVSLYKKSIGGSVSMVADNYIKEHEIDLLVLGTKGASALEEIFIGSNASALIEHASCSILAAPTKAEYLEPKNLVLAADLAEINSDSTFSLLPEICTQFETNVQVVTVLEENAKNIQLSNKSIDKFLTGVPHSFHVESNEDVTDGIANFIEEHTCDWISVHTRKYGFFKELFHQSVAKEMAMHTNKPLLITREK